MVGLNTSEENLRDLAGKVQDAVSGLTGDAATQARSKVDEVAGKAQNMYGQAADGIRGVASDQPMMTMLAAAGLGIVLGVLIGRR